MANDQIEFFNYKRRYKWRASDFQDFQTGMLDTIGGAFEGAFNKVALGGFNFESAIGANMMVAPGIAIGPTGYLMALNTESSLTVPLPATGTSGARHLVVARPLIYETDFINSPTVPFETFPLRVGFFSQVAVIAGTPSLQPDYPYGATGPNDVILFGVRLPPGATQVNLENVDMSIRDLPGKNSNFQQNQGLYDDRCRPYRSSPILVGIKPSQIVHADLQRAFLYVNKVTAAIYPKDGSGKFTPLDSFYNFATGTVTGGDASSPAFTAVIPAAGSFVVARISLSTGNQIGVNYGTAGTFAQCLDGIVNQRTAGAGSVNIQQSRYPIANVIVGSVDGINITSLDVMDARSTFSFGGPDTGGSTTVVTKDVDYQIAAGDSLIRGNPIHAVDINLTAPDAIANPGIEFTVNKIDASANLVKVVFLGGQSVAGLTTYPVAEQWQFVRMKSNGVGYDLVGAG